MIEILAYYLDTCNLIVTFNERCYAILALNCETLMQTMLSNLVHHLYSFVWIVCHYVSESKENPG